MTNQTHTAGTDAVPGAARLLQLAQQAADEQLAAAHAAAQHMASAAREHCENVLAQAQAHASSTTTAAELAATELLRAAREEEQAVQRHIDELNQARTIALRQVRELGLQLTHTADTSDNHAAAAEPGATR